MMDARTELDRFLAVDLGWEHKVTLGKLNQRFSIALSVEKFFFYLYVQIKGNFCFCSVQDILKLMLIIVCAHKSFKGN